MSDPGNPVDATPPIPGNEGPGGRIGPYSILRLLGEGGFGDVYEAEQEQPVKRRVALKIIKLGMDTREVIVRFEAERQALAMMEHPHIARVFDAGATGSGRPYFAMELVEGEPITTYCSGHDLPIAARLQLFDQVCTAVQHAHTKGVIHRDLKPSNILVSTQDGQPFAKVIDFGIAKATSGRLTDKTLVTEQFLMMGTPAYMSPEQAEGSADIDTRTDIYALGVILYELLTDTTPLDSTSLRSAGYSEVQRIIREVEPLRPSTRLARSPKTAPGTTARQRSEPQKLARAVRGELDWIVMKAIEKDRARRYETANALAMDVRRYLAGEPVLAAPPSAAYRLRKFVRRNKGTVAAGSLIAASLLVGIVGFAWQARLARQRADELQQVSNFQADMLSGVDLADAGKLLSDDVHAKFSASLAGEHLTDTERSARIAAFNAQWQHVDATDAARDLLDRTILKPAIVAIDAKFKSQPEVDAALRQVLARRYIDMAMFDAALPLQSSALATRRRVLGAEHPDTLDSLEGMGDVLRGQGKPLDAERYFRDAWIERKHVLGAEDPQTLASLDSLGLALHEEGKLDEAEPLTRGALEARRRVLGENNKDTIESLNNMGWLLQDQGKLDEAKRIYIEALRTARHVLGEEATDTLIMINNIGLLLQQQGKLKQAEPYFREALGKARRVWGEDHQNTLTLINNIALLLAHEGKPAEAEPFAIDALQKNRRLFGDDNPDTLISINTMGTVLVAEHRNSETVALLAPAEAATRNVFTGDALRRVGSLLMHLGEARTGLADFGTAESELLEAQPIMLKARGPESPDTRESTQSIVDLYTAWNKAEPGKGYGIKAGDWKRKLDALMTRASTPKPR